MSEQPREADDQQDEASATGTPDPRTGQDDGGARSGDRYSGTES